MKNRPRRSLLYMPGSNIRALEKARTLPADGFIFDLEDAVAPSAKEPARTQIAAAVRHGGYDGREIIIRVNGLDTEWWRQDVAAMAALPVDGILFPKIDSPEQIHAAVAALDKAGASSTLPVWIMAETPACILRVDAIAGSHPRLAGIMMGTADLAKALRAVHTPDRRALVTHLHLCVLAARTHGLNVIDGVHFDLEDETNFATVCAQGREMGFDGKTLIHPKQIDIANRVFAPSEVEVRHAQTLIAAWEQATADGKGVTVVNGQLVERLHVEEARRILALESVIKGMAGR